MKLSKRSVALIIALCLTFSLAFSLLFTKAIEQTSSVVNIPQLVNYQGRLTEDGNPITGSVTVTFSIYDVPTGGAPLWTETQNVTVTDGVFNTLLGSTNPLTPPVFSSEETYLGIQIEGDGEIQPRQRLASVAYAFFANDANTLRGMTPDDFVPANHIQDYFHMVFIGSDGGSASDDHQAQFTLTAPSEAKMVIINVSSDSHDGLRGAGQVTLTKKGCTETQVVETWFNSQIIVWASWTGDTVTITGREVEAGDLVRVRATAYFYR